MRPIEVARKAQKASSATGKKGVRGEKAAAIKVGRDSGRVKVFVRVRPFKPQEVSRKETAAVEVSELNSSIHVSDPKHSYEKDFPFDHVFPSGATNHEVCSTLCKPIVTSALNGFNGTLMAYGQTGSGKTYTLMAPDGIAAGVVDRCFKRIMQDTKHDYKVLMSYLQIYQEKIYDLLNSTNKVDLSIREHPSKGVYVENLSEFVVRGPSEVMNLLAVGKKRLVFAETKMNRTSSRSHSVCMLLIERTLSKEEGSKPKDCVPNGERKSPHHGKDRANSLSKRTSSPKKTAACSNISECPSDIEDDAEQDSLAKMTFTDDVLVRGRIHLCDLAGSERLKKTHAEGERLSEAQHINLSLLELGNVIHALADGTKTHVPFRNSTLTRLLQESLGGNCKTSLIVCVSPTINDVSETKSTLQFGSRAMKITNTAYVNVEVDYQKLSDDLSKMLNSREKDIEDLKDSYEQRIEKIKLEAEDQINTSMTAAQEALASVRSLFETKEEGLKSKVHQIDEELHREKHLSSQLRHQLSSLGSCLREGVYRAKSALLAELLSMQIFYTIRDMPDKERREVAGAIQDEYLHSGRKLAGVRAKVLENTDNVLLLFQSYLKLFNYSGQTMLNSGWNLKELEDAFLDADHKNGELVIREHESVDYVDLHSDPEKAYNKTDDDKVLESDHISLVDTLELKPEDFLNVTKNLRDRLEVIKDGLDGDAVDFLKKAFALDDDKECSRKQVYGTMMEFLRQREHQEGSDALGQSTIPMLDAEIALLDQSLCHVLVDKALQSSILLLEFHESKTECDQLLKNNSNLNKELEVMRHQVETLVSENTKLNSKLSETSTFLHDVKTSKELLENDLSSVFQLYNMRSQAKPDLESNLKDGISTLVEENAKLKVELKDTQDEKRDLQMQLKKAKEEIEKMSILVETLQRNNAKASKSTQTFKTLSQNIGNLNSELSNDGALDDNETDVQLKESKGHLENSENDVEELEMNNMKKKFVSKRLVDIEHFLINLQDELVKLEDDESALFMHTNQRQAVSSLRLNLNKRLGELWSIEVVESKKLRARVEELTIKLNDYEKQIEGLETELHNESQVRLNLENELNQYRKEVIDLGAEIWTTRLEPTKDDAGETFSGSHLESEEPTPRDEIDSARVRSSLSFSISRCNSDDSLHDNRKAELYLAEMDTKKSKEELKSLQQTFMQLNQDLADSGRIRQEMEERFLNLANENKAITLKFKAYEENKQAMEEKIIHISSLKTTLQEELSKLKEAEHVHLEDIRGYKEKIAIFEVEKTQLKQELSQMEIKFTTMDNKYQEMNKELAETRKRLKDAQARLKAREQELGDLHDAYDRIRSHIRADDSDRESLVEVKMKSGARDSPTPSRIQSIHLVSRVKSQGKKRHPSFLASKKKMSMKRSPRNDEILPRRNTLKRGASGRRGTLTSPRGDSRTLTRGDSERDTLKRAKGPERRTLKRDNEEDQKLKSELLLAKEQLIRLKGELTLSNIQTANLGTHLTSLREDSNKLEVELSSLRRTPGSKGMHEDFRISKGDLNIESELGNAKEKIIELQDIILNLRREKTFAEEKVSQSEGEVKQLRSEIYKSRDALERSQEVVKIMEKEIELLKTKNQILQHRLTSYTSNEAQMLLPVRDIDQDGDNLSYDQSGLFFKLDQDKLLQHEQDKIQLEKEIEQLSNEKVKLEDMQNLVQQLVEVEDEQLLLKRRLRKVVKQARKDGDEEDDTNTSNDGSKSEEKRMYSKMVAQSQQSDENKLEEYYVENTALRCELDALRIYISNLENENKTAKYKLSVSESMHGNSDKKVLATLLASAKHEREELRETLNSVYSEKEDMEEALNVARVKNQRLQRELTLVNDDKNDLQRELDSIKNDSHVISEKDKPSAGVTVDESRAVDLIKGFLINVGARNTREKDIKEFAKTLLSRKSQQTGRNTKAAALDQRQRRNSSSSFKQSPAKLSNKTSRNVQGSRTGTQTNTNASKTTKPEPSKTNCTSSGLRRLKPGTDRGIPEGMEDKKHGKTNIPKTQEVKDDLSLIYLDVDNPSVKDTPTTNEVLIKRAWSLRDLFKRSTVKTPAANPQVINQ